jgi:RNA polymerase primary sigma factor
LPSNTSARQRTHRALSLYLSEIKHLKPFTPEEEVDLARRAKAGDQDAFNQLITHNLRFVVAVAKKFQNHGVPLEDLINEGNLGLIKAVHRYDETRGFRFISYAVWWISQSIRQAIAKTGRIVRLPVSVTESIGSLYRQSLELEQAYEREPTAEELAAITDKTIEEIEQLIQNFSFPASLDDPVEDSGSTLQDFLLTGTDRPEAQIMKESIHYEILQVLHTLDEREEYVIVNYFGLNRKEAKTLDEIGAELGVSRERVRQIKERALQRLRHHTRSHLLRLYLS